MSQNNNNPIQINEAKDLIEAYMSPLGNSLGAGLNNGWYSSCLLYTSDAADE